MTYQEKYRELRAKAEAKWEEVGRLADVIHDEPNDDIRYALVEQVNSLEADAIRLGAEADRLYDYLNGEDCCDCVLPEQACRHCTIAASILDAESELPF